MKSRIFAQIFIWSFLIIEGYIIWGAISNSSGKPVFGFGSWSGFFLETGIALFCAFIVLIMCMSFVGGDKIGEFISEKHKEVISNKDINTERESNRG